MPRTTRHAALSCIAAALALAATPWLHAQESELEPEGESEVEVLEDVEVIAAPPRVVTPLPGVQLDEGQLTTNVQQATGEDIRDAKAVNTTDFLNEQFQSITVSNNTGNPFQQDIVFRGFSASPLIATPQGLSVYLDGARINEPFGDVINWDLIPLNAIDGMVLMPGSNPLFGLNTLGGALSLTTKSGFTWPGIEATALAGSWGRRQYQFTAGASEGPAAAFLAVNQLREDGWRDDSPSALDQVFGRVDLEGRWGQLTFSGLHADTELIGNGQVPYEDYVVRPESVYTSPDGVDNQVTQIWLAGRGDISDELSASGMAYHRDSTQQSISGDFWDQWNAATSGRVDACDPNGLDGVPDGVRGDNTLADGANAFDGPGIPGCIPNGVLGRGYTEQDGSGLTLQLNWATERNQLVVGATYDRSQVFFEQTEQLGDISATREIVVNPDRPYPYDADDLVAFEAFDDLVGFLEELFPDDPATVQLFIDAFCGEDPTLCVDGVPRGAPSNRVGDLFAAAESPILRNRLNGENDTWAVFFFDVFALRPTLNLSLGARYSRTKVSNNVVADRPIPLYQYTPALVDRREERCGVEDGDPLARFQCTSESFVYKAFNPAGGLSWQAAPDLNLFANVSRGSRTPSAIELACARDKEEVDPDIFQGCTIPTALTNDPFLPQVRSTTYEFGGRGSVDWLFDWNAAAFQTDLEDDILFVSLGIGNRGVFDTFGQTRRRGVEFGLEGQYERTRWYLNYSFVDATFESPATVINLSNSTSRKVQGELNEFDIEPGDRIPGIPQHSLRASVSHDVTPRLTMAVTAIAQSSSFVRGNENNEHRPGGTDADDSPRPRARRYVGEGEIDGFVLFNLDAEYSLTTALSMFLQVDNVFDADYVTAGQLGLNSFTPSRFGIRDASGFNFNSNDWTHSQFVGPGAPRAIWVGLRLSLY